MGQVGSAHKHSRKEVERIEKRYLRSKNEEKRERREEQRRKECDMEVKLHSAHVLVRNTIKISEQTSQSFTSFYFTLTSDVVECYALVCNDMRNVPGCCHSCVLALVADKDGVDALAFTSFVSPPHSLALPSFLSPYLSYPRRARSPFFLPSCPCPYY